MYLGFFTKVNLKFSKIRAILCFKQEDSNHENAKNKRNDKLGDHTDQNCQYIYDQT